MVNLRFMTIQKAIEYSYNVMPQLFRQDGDNVRQVNPDQSFSSLGLGASAGSNSLMSSMMSTNVFFEMPENTDLYEGQYDVKAGRWPKKYNECDSCADAGWFYERLLIIYIGTQRPG